MKLGGNINLFGYDIRWYVGGFKSFTTWKTGITNRCKDGMFVLFLDYDGVPLSWVIEELEHITNMHGLGDIHIFRTVKGYHAINTEKRTFTEILDLMRLTSCDHNFINVPLRYGKKAWTLRVSKKKGKERTMYVKTIRGKGQKVMSTPHNWLIQHLYGVKVRKGLEDGEKHFYKSQYPISE